MHNIKTWRVNPLDKLLTSWEEISPVEQRQFLYNKERQLDKSVRLQWRTNVWIKDMLKVWSSMINSILSLKSDELLHSSWLNQWLTQIENRIDAVWNWISNLGDKVDLVWDWINIINNNQVLWFQMLWAAVQDLNQNQLEWLKLTLSAIWDFEKVVEDWFNDLIIWISEQTYIFQNALVQVWQILETLENPSKTEWLENKKEALGCLKNWWWTEALEFLKRADEKLIVDEEVLYFMWLIEFEVNSNYELAKEYLEKSAKYAWGHSNTRISIEVNDKLASINFIEWWDRRALLKAYNYQDIVVNIYWSTNILHLKSYIKYSILIWERDDIEEVLKKIYLDNYQYLFLLLDDPLIVTDTQVVNLLSEYIKEHNEIEEENNKDVNKQNIILKRNEKEKNAKLKDFFEIISEINLLIEDWDSYLSLYNLFTKTPVFLNDYTLNIDESIIIQLIKKYHSSISKDNQHIDFSFRSRRFHSIETKLMKEFDIIGDYKKARRLSHDERGSNLWYSIHGHYCCDDFFINKYFSLLTSNPEILLNQIKQSSWNKKITIDGMSCTGSRQIRIPFFDIKPHSKKDTNWFLKPEPVSVSISLKDTGILLEKDSEVQFSMYWALKLKWIIEYSEERKKLYDSIIKILILFTEEEKKYDPSQIDWRMWIFNNLVEIFEANMNDPFIKNLYEYQNIGDKIEYFKGFNNEKKELLFFLKDVRYKCYEIYWYWIH